MAAGGPGSDHQRRHAGRQSDSATLAAVEAGLAELARGDSVTLDDLRRDLAERRAVH